MNRMIFIVLIFLLIVNVGCVHSQNKEEQITSMLKEFYIAHNKIWEIKPPLPPNKLDYKLDSLQQKYCTSKLRIESKKYLELGHDLLTNDIGGTNSKEFKSTLKIRKDTTKENTYIVSYFIEIKTSSASYKKENVIYLSVIEEGEGYKIDAVW